MFANGVEPTGSCYQGGGTQNLEYRFKSQKKLSLSVLFYSPLLVNRLT